MRPRKKSPAGAGLSQCVHCDSSAFLYSYLLGRPRWLGGVLKRQSCKRCDVPTSSKIVFSPKCDLMKRIKSASFRQIVTDLIDRSSVSAESSSLEQMTRKTGAVLFRY